MKVLNQQNIALLVLLVSGGVCAQSGIPPHIADAPAGQWTSIGTNTLEDVKFVYTNPPDGFRVRLQSIMDAWSGAAFDPNRNRLVVHGGGHRDYDGNELYAFDLVANRWERLNDPTVRLESEAVEQVFDEPPLDSPEGDTPGPVHTYDFLEIDPRSGLIYRLENGGSPIRNIWAFDAQSVTWIDTGMAVSASPGSGTNAASVWDPASERFWLADGDMGCWTRFASVDPVSGQTQAFSVDGGGNHCGRKVATIRTDTEPSSVVVIGGSYLAQWGVGSATAEQPLLSGDLGFQGSGRQGLAYDAARGVIWVYDEDTPGKLYRVDPQSWESIGFTPGGAIPTTSTGNGIYGRFRYVPEYDVLIMVNQVNAPVFMYKPQDWRADFVFANGFEADAF